MIFLKILFWASLFIVFYSYLGYGILLYLLVKIKRLFRKGKATIDGFEPPVTLVVSAYNEEGFIKKKVENTFKLQYPKGKLKLIFVTDGSTDSTPDIIRGFPEINLLHEVARKGKVAAMNRAMQFVDTPIVIFSDANTLLNEDCIKQIAKHYADPMVGGVAGEKKVATGDSEKASGAGEGLYWKYESLLKKLDSELYSVVGAAGELFSVRTSLYENAGENLIIEDFVMSLKICMKGYIIKYEPGAFATEDSSPSMKEEQKRKVRICAGGFQSMIILRELFNVFKYPVLSFQFISHRVLRWTLSPICLITLLITNIAIVLKGSNFVYQALLTCQILFYLSAMAGWYFANKEVKVKMLFVPYYFLFMNISVFMGFKRFITKTQSVLWEKSARK
ncbi:MAG: glycosyltransferase family 2 protein [Bacteroidetes bacterium]|nr:glycosyltransferase family 2 protein [Bacteroidota bacterium]